MNTLTCTLESLHEMDAHTLDQFTRRVVGTLGVSRLWLGRCLIALQRDDKAIHLGYSGPIHCAILLGVEHREAVEARRVARRLEELPILRGQAENGTIPWASLREIVSKASPQTEERWAELAAKLTTGKIARLVSMTAKGEMPGEGDLERREPRSIELRGRFEGARMCIVEQAMRLVSEAEGRPVSFEEYLVEVSLARISGSLNPDAKTVEKIYENAERDLAAAQEAPWAAVAAVEEPSPSDPEVQLAKPARVPHRANTRLDFNPQSRHLSDGQRAEILRRDGYRCSTPDCPHNLWLQVHHVVFYCNGGATVPENLALCCGACHRNIHNGYLEVVGAAPQGLDWSTNAGPIGEINPARGLGWLVPEEDT